MAQVWGVIRAGYCVARSSKKRKPGQRRTVESINAMEREFLEASITLREQEAAERQRAAEEREAQRQRELEAQRRYANDQSRAASRFRRLAVVLAVAVIAMIAAAIFAWNQAGRQRKRRTPKSNVYMLRHRARKLKSNARLPIVAARKHGYGNWLPNRQRIYAHRDHPSSVYCWRSSRSQPNKLRMTCSRFLLPRNRCVQHWPCQVANL